MTRKRDAAPLAGGAHAGGSIAPKSTAAILSIRPEPAGPDHYGRTPEVRLRLLLKHCLRLYGWRVVTLDVPRAAAPEPGKGGDHGR